MNKLWIGAGLLVLWGCRDEQAGPKNRPSPQAQAPATAQPAPSNAALQTLDAAPTDLTFKSGGTWADGTIQYLGSKLEPAQPTAGQTVRISHYFIALKPPPQGWNFFIHII